MCDAQKENMLLTATHFLLKTMSVLSKNFARCRTSSSTDEVRIVIDSNDYDKIFLSIFIEVCNELLIFESD